MQQETITHTIISCIVIFYLKQTSYPINKERNNPRQCRGIESGKGCPLPASRLLPDGYEGCDAGEIDKHKQHIAESHQRGNGNAMSKVYLFDVALIRIKYPQCTYHQLLRSYSRKNADTHFPVESQRLNHRFDYLAYLSDIRIFLLLSLSGIGIVIRIIPQNQIMMEATMMIPPIFLRYCTPFSHVWRATALAVGIR